VFEFKLFLIGAAIGAMLGDSDHFPSSRDAEGVFHDEGDEGYHCLSHVASSEGVKWIDHLSSRDADVGQHYGPGS
jgi:hypothetical protein